MVVTRRLICVPTYQHLIPRSFSTLRCIRCLRNVSQPRRSRFKPTPRSSRLSWLTFSTLSLCPLVCLHVVDRRRLNKSNLHHSLTVSLTNRFCELTVRMTDWYWLSKSIIESHRCSLANTAHDPNCDRRPTRRPTRRQCLAVHHPPTFDIVRHWSTLCSAHNDQVFDVCIRYRRSDVRLALITTCTMYAMCNTRATCTRRTTRAAFVFVEFVLAGRLVRLEDTRLDD